MANRGLCRLVLVMFLVKRNSTIAFTGSVKHRYPIHSNIFGKRSVITSYFIKNHHPIVKTQTWGTNDEESTTDSSNASDTEQQSFHQEGHVGGRRKDLRNRSVRSTTSRRSALSMRPKSAWTLLRKSISDLFNVRTLNDVLLRMLWALEILAFTIILRSFFVGSASDGTTSSTNPNFMYYQSTVIERRVIGSNGDIETSRKESFQSNIPDLVREQQKQRSSQSTLDLDDTQVRRSIDKQFRKNDEQMRRSMRMLMDNTEQN
jgi:hypothetical protein